MSSDHFRSGLNKVKLGLHDQAIEEFEKAAWEDPDNFEVQYNLGTAFLTIGEFYMDEAPLREKEKCLVVILIWKILKVSVKSIIYIKIS